MKNALKRILKGALFPHIAVIFALIPLSAVLLACSAAFFGTEAIPTYISYAFAAYTLTVLCCGIPRITALLKCFKTENKVMRRLSTDVRLRVNVSLLMSLFCNFAYAALQLYLGIEHRSFWFYSLFSYYILLAFMRLYLILHTSKKQAGESMRNEMKRYCVCGFVFLVMNLALSMMIFFMVYFGRTFEHNEVTTIAIAAYTFTAFTVSVVNTVRYRKYNSPVFSASKAISLAAACVSVLILTQTMLTAFGEGADAAFNKTVTALTGIAVSGFIIGMALYMIVKGIKGYVQQKRS